MFIQKKIQSQTNQANKVESKKEQTIQLNILNFFFLFLLNFLI